MFYSFSGRTRLPNLGATSTTPFAARVVTASWRPLTFRSRRTTASAW